MPLPPYIHAPLADPERYQTVYAGARARSRRRPPGSTSPTRCSTAAAARGSRGRAGRPRRRPRHVRPDRGRRSRRPRDAHRALLACRRDRGGLRRAPAGRRGRHHHGARARIGAHGAISKGGPTCSSAAPFEFRVVDVLLTNFHLPRRRCSCCSTRSSAPGGATSTTDALDEGYRFLSFGDAMLVGRRPGAHDDRCGFDARRRSTATARAGTVDDRARVVPTPCFMPVGTRGAVRTLSRRRPRGPRRAGGAGQHLPPDAAAGRRRGGRAGGLHGFTGWPGHVLTDSGGYQVFSLSPTVDDDGVTFRSTYDGSRPTASRPRARSPSRRRSGPTSRWCSTCARRCRRPPRSCALAVDRTAAWAARARCRVHRATDGTRRCSASCRAASTPQLRAESARRTVELGFDGYGIGGLSVGEPRDEMLAGARPRPWPSSPPTGPAT